MGEQGRALLGGKQRAALFEQELAEQRVVVVDRCRVAAAVGEKVAPVQAHQQGLRVHRRAECTGIGNGEPRHHGGAHQEVARGVVHLGEQLADEVGEQRFPQQAGGTAVGHTGAARMVHHHHEARRPAVAHGVHRVDGGLGIVAGGDQTCLFL